MKPLHLLSSAAIALLLSACGTGDAEKNNFNTYNLQAFMQSAFVANVAGTATEGGITLGSTGTVTRTNNGVQTVNGQSLVAMASTLYIDRSGTSETMMMYLDGATPRVVLVDGVYCTIVGTTTVPSSAMVGTSSRSLGYTCDDGSTARFTYTLSAYDSNLADVLEQSEISLANGKTVNASATYRIDPSGMLLAYTMNGVYDNITINVASSSVAH